MPAHQFGGPLALVEADIVEDDDVAWLKLGSQLRLDPGLEAPGVHRRIDDPRRDHAVAAQAGDEGLRMPFAEGSVRPVALAFRRPAGALGQPGVGGRLVDEDQTGQGLGEEALAPRDPQFARLTDVGTFLLAGLQRFFCG